MRAAVITRERLMVVATPADVEAHCRARELLWALQDVAAKDRTVFQSVRIGRARKLVKRGLG